MILHYLILRIYKSSKNANRKGVKKEKKDKTGGKNSEKTIDDLLDELSDDEEESSTDSIENVHNTTARTPAAMFIEGYQKSGIKGNI